MIGTTLHAKLIQFAQLNTQAKVKYIFFSPITQKLSLAEESKALKQQMKLLEDKLSTTEAENARLQEEVNVFSAVKNLINRSDSKI